MAIFAMCFILFYKLPELKMVNNIFNLGCGFAGNYYIIFVSLKYFVVTYLSPKSNAIGRIMGAYLY